MTITTTAARGPSAGAVVAGGIGGGRPCLDSKLVHHPLNQPTTTSTTATTTTTTTTTASLSSSSPPVENDLQKIPLDVLLEIALLLPSSQDFASLLQTCRYVYHNLDTRWVWHQRFMLRLGRAFMIHLLNPRDPKTNELLSGRVEEVKDTSVVGKETLMKWYWTYTRNSVPPKEMNLAHANNGYWSYESSDSRTPHELVAKLTSGLWWLDISAVLYGVLPGRYWVQWGLVLSNDSSIEGSQFRVAAFSRDEIPIWDNEAKNSIDYRPKSTRHFFHHTTVINKNRLDPTEDFVFQLPEILVVDKDKPTLFAQMREHHSYKDGVTVLFVRIVPAGDEEVDAMEYKSVKGKRRR